MHSYRPSSLARLSLLWKFSAASTEAPGLLIGGDRRGCVRREGGTEQQRGCMRGGRGGETEQQRGQGRHTMQGVRSSSQDQTLWIGQAKSPKHALPPHTYPNTRQSKEWRNDSTGRK